uniref:hypothetical protein n=1 Tax=Ornithobacterium rhinotracheale TaxID=28251 RepID=UPI0039A43478
MNRIKIKLTPEQLDVVLQGIDGINFTQDRSIPKRVVLSIFDEVHTKLLRKQIEKRNELKNKAFTLKLKYYEAYALHEILGLTYIGVPDFFYEKNVCFQLLNDLNQQLI